MSLPLTRRIARAALLVAAGAAAGVGAAGTASAAPGLPAAPDLGGVTALDGAAQTVTGVAGETGGKTVEKATPAAQQAAGSLTGSAGDVLDDTAGAAAEGGDLPTDSLTSRGLPSAKTLPVQDLPLG
ncbi:ATP-binding protein [Streptomyces sp. H28]|uniref:ATP-binding protein n=1 Tax=Streptomyces sp. H28 TaxID=2775865 RepID=UPI001786964C|nr:ATP-binding protein [Streptomyces sp. H28]MBD9732197.1 ATP-binding protein [Streptomyces sp. H28]